MKFDHRFDAINYAKAQRILTNYSILQKTLLKFMHEPRYTLDQFLSILVDEKTNSHKIMEFRQYQLKEKNYQSYNQYTIDYWRSLFMQFKQLMRQ